MRSHINNKDLFQTIREHKERGGAGGGGRGDTLREGWSPNKHPLAAPWASAYLKNTALHNVSPPSPPNINAPSKQTKQNKTKKANKEPTNALPHVN